MRAKLTAPFVLLIATLASCGDRGPLATDNKARAVATDSAPIAYVAARERRAANEPARAAQVDAVHQAALASAWSAQKLIRTAELRLQVSDVPRAIQLADSVARLRDALVADVKINNDAKGRRDAQLVIRVAAARFAQTVAALRELGEVKGESMSTDDVTKAYADLETRLAVKEQTLTRLRALLANRTGKLSDVLEVERELSTVITDVEQMKGERRYYDQRVAISSISVTLYEPGVLVRPGFTGPVAEAFRSSLEVLATSVAGLIYLVTFVTPWVVVVGGAWWGMRRTRRRGPAAPKAATT